MTAPSPLRVGFIVDGPRANTYVFDLIKAVAQDPAHFAAPVIFSQELLAQKKPKLERILEKLRHGDFEFLFRTFLTKVVCALESRKVRAAGHPHFGLSYDLGELGIKTQQISPIKSPSGFIHKFNEADIQKIVHEECDVLIRCGTGILKGKILSAARLGVLSFHHGDNRVNRGMPPGFWEVLNDEPSSGFIIQQLTEELDGGHVLMRGNLMTSSFWNLNYARLLQKSNHFMVELLRRIAHTGTLPKAEEPIPYFNRLLKAPSIAQLLHYVLKEYRHFAIAAFQRKIGYTDRWSVSFIPKSGMNVVLFRGITIKNPSRHFLADPFVLEHQGRAVCFVEDYSYDERKGKISAYELDGKSYKPLGVVLEEDFHLSYPYVFKHDGEIYMVPETSGAKQIRLYKCEAFPHKWKLVKVLMDSVHAADTVVFESQGKWYMLTNFCSAGSKDCLSELHAFVADDLFADKWTPLPDNPVVFDSRRARNGGFFRADGKVYRVNQVASKNHYGTAVQINEIKEISPTSYIEQEVCTIHPNYFEGLAATHHVSMSETYTVFDHNRFERLV